MYKLGENVASKNNEIKPMSETNAGAKLMLVPNRNRNQTYEQNQCRGEPYVRPLTENEIKPISDCEGKP
jgi:hypothetical protein